MLTPSKLAIWTASLLLIGLCSTAAADEKVYLACHLGVSLTATDVRDVFLGEKQFFKSIRLVPVDNLTAQDAFLEKVLHMNASRYANAWAKKSFRDGVDPPDVKLNDMEVLKFIERVPGGCGYFFATPPADVAVIGKY